MALYTYVKAPPQNLPQSHGKPVSKKLARLTPTIFITLGSILIANVAWPILQYQLFVSPGIQRSQLITPININRTAFFAPTSSSAPLDNPLPQVLSQEIDYTNANNWFPSADQPQLSTSKITHYTVTIPKLNIEDAVVEIGGEDLANNLIQYPGTANPGQLGAPVIFGHSILRQFYNPSRDNPKRYVSIFSKIMTLKSGDEIFIDFDGIRYKYVMKEKLEIKPEDVYILQQRYNNRELKLITCVPEGTYLRRGVIVAQLEELGQPTNIH